MMRIISWLENWFSQPGKGVLRMVERRMLAAGYYETLPTAGPEFRYGIAADATGVQVCQPDGAGWVWVSTDAITGVLRVYQDADYTGTSNTTAAQKVFDESTNGAANVAASTIYHMEGVMTLRTTDVDSAFANILFGGTATLNWIGYDLTSQFHTALDAFGSSGTFSKWMTAATAAALSAANATAKVYVVTIDGHVSIANAGTFIPQYSWSANTQANPITGRGSWFRLTPVPATTAGSWG